MKNYSVKFAREFEVQVQADTLEVAQVLARRVIAQFPTDSCKLLSIIAEGCEVESVSPPEKPQPPFGRPSGGGTPGTPVVRVEELVDQIAEAA